MEKETNSREKHASDLIQTIGDIVIKSILNHENATIQKGIDNLIEIAIEFLEMKSESQQKYLVENESYLIKSLPENQYITYIVNEFARIFEIAQDNKNSNVCRYMILKLSKILDKIMTDEKNGSILEQVIETRGFYGSLYYRLMEISIKNNAKNDKMLLLQHLSSFPNLQIINQRYRTEYLDEFINQHIFRVSKLIIDAGDFEIFKDEVNQFSTFIQLNDPGHLTKEIEGELYGLTYHPELMPVVEKLAFKIRTSCLKDLSSINQFLEDLQNLKKEIISKDQSKNIEIFNSSFDYILSQINEFRIATKIYSVFFIIGAYLVFKGKQYDKFIRELWYHTTPVETDISMSNRTPVSDDLTWLTFFITYRGEGIPFLHNTVMFDDFQDAEPFLYQYYALLLLKLGNVQDLPSDDQIETWKINNQNYKMDFFYDFARDLMPEKFIDALNKILDANIFTSTVRVKDTKERELQVRKQLGIFVHRIDELKYKITQKRSVLKEEVEEYEKIILETYRNNSHCKFIANIKYDENLSIENSKLLTSTLNIPREILTEKLSKPSMPGGPIASPLANLEMWHVISVIHNSNVMTITETDTDYERQIRNAVDHLLKKRYKPIAIFIPLKIKSALEYGQSTLFKEFGKNMIVDELELHTVYSWNQLPFDDIIIFDSKGLLITYKKEKLEERLQFEVKGVNEEEGPTVGIKCKLLINIKMNDPKAFVRIVNEQYKEKD